MKGHEAGVFEEDRHGLAHCCDTVLLQDIRGILLIGSPNKRPPSGKYTVDRHAVDRAQPHHAFGNEGTADLLALGRKDHPVAHYIGEREGGFEQSQHSLQHEKTSLNRVGGGLLAPTSHTTVRAVRHTAVPAIPLFR